MKYTLLFTLLLLTTCYIPGPMPSTTKWKLEIKNEYGTEDPIVLKGGRFTKILLVLSPENGEQYLDYSQDKSKFEIYTNDANIQIPGSKFELEPAKSLEYSAFIGLKCESLENIKESFYLIDFQVKGGEQPFTPDQDPKDPIFEDPALIVQPLNVTIDSSKTKISLTPLLTAIPERSYTLLKLQEPLYNIEKIKIHPTNQYNDFKFDKIEFDKFDSKKGEKEFTEENGILFDSKIGTHLTFAQLNQTNFKFDIELENNQECFALEPESFTFDVLDERPIDLNNGTKESIIYSIENVTPKRDETSNIQIKMNIPVAPIILECEIGDDEQEFYISEAGEKTIKFDNLKVENGKYIIECEFEDTKFENSNEFKIKIGNGRECDAIMDLVPSKDINRIPQCAEFTFSENSNSDELKQFESLAVKYCSQLMNGEEPIFERIRQDIICKSVDVEEDKGKEKDKDKKEEKKMKYNICIGASPNNQMMFKPPEKKVNFTEKFGEFINNLSDKNKINEALGLFDLEVESINRYYDYDAPDTSKIKIYKEQNDQNKIKFNITSTNSQPIECFYNEELKINVNKKYMNLDIDSVILNEGETKHFEVEIKDKPKKDAMLSLFMNCYNLPGFEIRYESTGFFIAYTIYYGEKGIDDDEEDEEEDKKEDKNNIDCTDEKFAKHPYCLKDKSKPIINKMKTKMPDFIEDMIEQSDEFEKLSPSKQFKYLEQTKDELNDNREKMKTKENQQNRKELVEKSTELAEFLNKRDCSLYKDTTQYNECRNKKKEIFTDLVSDIKNYFKLEKMLHIIEEGMTDDAEQNLKYILFLISEITNNADSLKEGESEVLYNITLWLQENFQDIWNEIQTKLKEKASLNASILAIKKDISFMLLKSLSNLVNILHYDEIDGYIKNAIIPKKGKKIHTGIFKFIKHFNDFGTGEYSISDKMNVSVTVLEENSEANARLLLEETEEENEKQTHNISHKGIFVILHPKKMMKKKKGYVLQFVVLDSPLVPLEKNKNKVVISDFISITIYDKDGNEININDLSGDEKPILLYNKNYHKYLSHCFYYNEKTEELETDGVEASDNVKYEGKKYFQCTTKHLTAFTAGDKESDDDDDSSDGWKIFLIVLSCLIVVAIAVFLFFRLKKAKGNNQIEKNFSGEEGLMNNV